MIENLIIKFHLTRIGRVQASHRLADMIHHTHDIASRLHPDKRIQHQAGFIDNKT